MELLVKIDVFDLLKEGLENLPESSLSVPCIHWKYDEVEFVFKDVLDEGQERTLTAKDFVTGFELYWLKLSHDRKLFILEPSNWDALVIDAIVQLSLFGEVRYG